MAITALVLAAGASRRFGADDKLLADAGGAPVLVRVLRALGAAAITRIVVAVRADGAAVRRAVEAAGCRAPVRFAEVAAADGGLASSLVAGLALVTPEDAEGLLVTPGDMPGLTRPTVERLVAAYVAEGGDRIAYAALPDGSQRNPVIWPRRFWPTLGALSGDVGGKHVIRAIEVAEGKGIAVEVADVSELADIDTKADLERFLAGRAAPGGS